MRGAQVIGSARWSVPADGPSNENAFQAVSRMRGVLAAWDKPTRSRLVLAVLVYEPNDGTRIDVIDAVLREYVPQTELLDRELTEVAGDQAA